MRTSRVAIGQLLATPLFLTRTFFHTIKLKIMITQLTKKISCLVVLFFALAKLNAQCSFCFLNLAVNQVSGQCKERVSWHPDTETSTMNYWAIDKSTNSTAWVQIGTVAGSPNTVHPAGYTVTFDDTNPYSLSGTTVGGTVYYRVRAVNTDGLSPQISPIVAKQLPASGCSTTPNPSFCSSTPTMSAPNLITLCDAPASVSLASSSVQTTNWTSSNTAVFTVSSSGLPYGSKITPVATGTATLTATQPYCNRTITKTISVCVCPSTLVAPSGIPTGTLTWATPPNYYGYILNFNTVPGVSSYYMEWWDASANPNVLLNTYTLTGPGQFYYYFPAGRTYKYRIASQSNCGTIGAFSAFSANLLPPAASCANGPISSTLTYTIGCGGGSGCPFTNVSWPAIAGATQYKVEYKIVNTSAGLTGPTGFVYPTSANTTIYYTPLSGAGWTISYRVAAMCSGTYGNFSGWSSNFFLQ